MSFNNSGTVNVDAGGLDLQSSSGGTNTGTIDADAGTTLSFSVSYTHDASSALLGQGTLTFNGGTHTFTGTLSTNRIININGLAVNFNAPRQVSSASRPDGAWTRTRSLASDR
jgi:hypothetical protein